MALQLGALRDALIDAGAGEAKANKAAEEVAAYERDLAGIRSDLRLLTWMVGALSAVAAVVGVPAIWLLVRVATKIGAIG